MQHGFADAADQAKDASQDAAQKVRSSRGYQFLVKVGLLSYGVMHLLIAYLALQLAFGLPAEASQSGALRQMADTSVGLATLWIVAVGFLALVVWQLVAVLIGFKEFEDFKRLRKRISAGFRIILYGYLCVAAARVAVGAQTSQDSQTEESISGGLLTMPLGPMLVIAVGTAIAVYGGYQIYKGISRKFNEDLDADLTGASAGLAVVGHIAKGLGYLVVGGLFWWAAVAWEPERAGGLDDALAVIGDMTFGDVLLAVLAVGLACYGLYCFLWARHAKNA